MIRLQEIEAACLNDVAVGVVARDGVADLLGGGLLLLGLDGRGNGVGLALDEVAGLLEVRLLGVGLSGGGELGMISCAQKRGGETSSDPDSTHLVTESLAASVRHC